MIYQNDELVRQLTQDCIDSGSTVFQIHRLGETERDHVARLLDAFDPHGVILDAGCGIGAVAGMMQDVRPDLDFILLNISPAQLDLCGSRFQKAQGSFHDIPLPDSSVDGVMFNYSLGHGDVKTCFKEAARVTRSGGNLFVYDLAAEDNTRLVEALDYHAASASEMLEAAKECGYVVDDAFSPSNTNTEHFMDKMNPDTFARVFDGVTPVLLRFTKP